MAHEECLGMPLKLTSKNVTKVLSPGNYLVFMSPFWHACDIPATSCSANLGKILSSTVMVNLHDAL